MLCPIHAVRYGNFDIYFWTVSHADLDPHMLVWCDLSPIPAPSCPCDVIYASPLMPVLCDPRRARPYRRLTGACDPMLSPIPVFRHGGVMGLVYLAAVASDSPKHACLEKLHYDCGIPPYSTEGYCLDCAVHFKTDLEAHRCSDAVIAVRKLQHHIRPFARFFQLYAVPHGWVVPCGVRPKCRGRTRLEVSWRGGVAAPIFLDSVLY